MASGQNTLLASDAHFPPILTRHSMTCSPAIFSKPVLFRGIIQSSFVLCLCLHWELKLLIVTLLFSGSVTLEVVLPVVWVWYANEPKWIQYSFTSKHKHKCYVLSAQSYFKLWPQHKFERTSSCHHTLLFGNIKVSNVATVQKRTGGQNQNFMFSALIRSKSLSMYTLTWIQYLTWNNLKLNLDNLPLAFNQPR